MPDNFRIEFYLLIFDSIIDDFSQRFDQQTMQFFSFGLTIHKKSIQSKATMNPMLKYFNIIQCNTLTLDSLLLLSKSFSFNLAPLQDELIELQAKHYELLNNDFIRFWCFIQKPTIKLLANQILSLFSSTYVCEASFFALNYIKSKRRSRLTDDHLLSALISAVSNLEPDYEFLSKDQQCQRSHQNIIDFDFIIIIKQEIFIKRF